jgi:sugar lactone lactonase YvrE
MRLLSFVSLLVLMAGCATYHKDKIAGNASPQLTKLAEFKGVQVTGVTVAKDNRLFVCFPRWRDNVPFSVVEVMPDGSSRPYPDASWNNWQGFPGRNHFTSVQSVLVHGNSLFVLDTANPKFQGVMGKPALYEFDLATNILKRSYSFSRSAALKDSYLNDLRIDDETQSAFITDSGRGGLVVVDLQTGEARRVLQNHVSGRSEKVVLKIDNKPFLIDGNTPHIHADGIALTPDHTKIYYHALTGYHLYAVPTNVVTNDKTPVQTLQQSVTTIGKTPAPDGMIFDQKGNLYMGDLENHSIDYLMPDGTMKTLVQDTTIKWPDTFAIDSQNNLIFTDSLLNEATPGKSVDEYTFNVYKVALPK